MATECDVNKSRRFDLGMSRRTRRSTSLVACYQDQHVQPLTQQVCQDAKLKTLFQCQDTELQALQQCEDAEQQTPYLYEDQDLKIPTPYLYEDQDLKIPTPYLYEDQDLKIPQAPQQCEGLEQKAPKQYQDEQQEKPQRYRDEEQEKKPQQYQDEEQKTIKQYQAEQQKTEQQYQDEEEKTPEQYQDEKQKTPEQYQDEEQYASEEENASEQYQALSVSTTTLATVPSATFYQQAEQTAKQYQDEGQKAQQEREDTEQKALEHCQSVKKLITPPAVDDVPRFSLQELIQEKQLLIGEAKPTGKFSYVEKENVLADHKVSGAAAGGATLAMVIKRPDGGKKSMGVIRRCVKALNQMIKTKHGSKKNVPF